MLRHSVNRLKPVVWSQARNFWDWRPTDVRTLMREMDREIDRMERSFFKNSPLSNLAPRFLPVDCQEMKNNSYRFNLDLQGFQPEDIKVTQKEGSIKIEAHMDKTSQNGGRIQQSIVREVTLPEHIDSNTLKTVLYPDGILSIEATLGKPQEPKEIPIEHTDKDVPKIKV